MQQWCIRIPYNLQSILNLFGFNFLSFFLTFLNLCSFQYVASKQTAVSLKSSQQVKYVIRVSFRRREGPSLVSGEQTFRVWIRVQYLAWNLLRRNSMGRNVGSSDGVMCVGSKFLASLPHSLSLSGRVGGNCIIIIIANILINYCKQFATDELILDNNYSSWSWLLQVV